MDEINESINCLCNSPQRHHILSILVGSEMDVRGLMRKLDCSRSTVQRNLTELKQRGWIEETRFGYKITTIGELFHTEFTAANETADTIERMTPFFEAVDRPPKISMSLLTDALVMTPEPGQPTSLMVRLSTTFEGTSRVRGFLPVVSLMSVQFSRQADTSDYTMPECDYVLSADAFDILCQWYGTDSAHGTEIEPPTHIHLWIHEGTLPYGLFVSDEQFALVAYDEIGHIQALVESTNKDAIEWGKGMYEMYKNQSIELSAMNILTT